MRSVRSAPFPRLLLVSLTLAVVLSLASCGSDAFAPNPAPPQLDLLTLHLEGIVLRVDRQPAADAEVVLYGCVVGLFSGGICSPSEIASTLTGPDGRYSLVVPSACTQTFWRGYVQGKYARVGQELQAEKSAVRCAEAVQQVDIQLCRVRAISGGRFVRLSRSCTS